MGKKREDDMPDIAEREEMMLERGNKAGIVCCSDGLRQDQQTMIMEMREILSGMNISVMMSPYLYEKEGTAIQKAQVLMALYENTEVDVIFDISGGDLANEILGYLDYEKIKQSRKTFWGYSDLTSVLNGIYKKTGNPGVLYQIRNLAGACGEEQRVWFGQMLDRKGADLFRFEYSFLQGDELDGIVVGGNIRCLLKLAGTEYFPEFDGKILLLESMSGGLSRITAYFSQLQQMGVFARCAGILLGTFTQLEKEQGILAAPQLLERFVDSSVPVVKTQQIGHGPDSRAVVIGGEMSLHK
ncbi:MAG: LD-carboxypeptidase [Lachnospiraceae bacterium]|nr:LD-carboxypeptidase [Lachnospiraceae bacterium]